MHEINTTMTTIAEEIAADGPYTVERVEKEVTHGRVTSFRVVGPTESGLHSWSEMAMEMECTRLNAAYKQGQQDRWISVEERLPVMEKVANGWHQSGDVLTIDNLRPGEGDIWHYKVNFVRRTPEGAIQWMHASASHWMPLPSPPNPEQP